MVCWTKLALSRFSNILWIYEISFQSFLTLLKLSNTKHPASFVVHVNKTIQRFLLNNSHITNKTHISITSQGAGSTNHYSLALYARSNRRVLGLDLETVGEQLLSTVPRSKFQTTGAKCWKPNLVKLVHWNICACLHTPWLVPVQTDDPATLEPRRSCCQRRQRVVPQCLPTHLEILQQQQRVGQDLTQTHSTLLPDNYN